MTLKLAAVTDSAKLMTGFGTVAKELLTGFHNAGIEVHQYGLLDSAEDTKNELPFSFYPVPQLDQLGHQTLPFFLRKIKPDVVFLLTDAGNSLVYLNTLLNTENGKQKRNGVDYIPPVVLYTPIEGEPLAEDFGKAFRMLERLNGSLVLYCNAARRSVIRQFPDLDQSRMHVVGHGANHANFRKYSDDDKRMLRELIGWNNKFVCGHVGVNKRTKGFTTLIYAAQYMRERGWDKDVLFYCHTNPDEDTMNGYRLRDLVKQYGVEDMFIFKPQIQRGNYWLGVDRDSDTLTQVRQIAGLTPETPEGRGLIFATYDFVSMLNCLDLYVDTSQSEGWGLTATESMACGVPTISVHDKHVRDEIYFGGAYMIEPLPRRCWDTWHTGARLVSIDPKDVAEAIMMMKDSAELREQYSKRGLECVARYDWKISCEQMTKIVLDTYENDQRCIGEEK